MTEVALWQLQARYEKLTAARAAVIADFDRAPDGSRRKAEAIHELDNLGRQVVAVETQIAALLDEPVTEFGWDGDTSLRIDRGE